MCSRCAVRIEWEAVRLVVLGVEARGPRPVRRGLTHDDELPRDCRHIELLNQSDFIELNGFKMDRLKLFFPVRQSDDECGEKGKMELSSCSSRGPVSSLASSNAARVYRVSTQFPLSLQVLRTQYRD